MNKIANVRNAGLNPNTYALYQLLDSRGFTKQASSCYSVMEKQADMWGDMWNGVKSVGKGAWQAGTDAISNTAKGIGNIAKTPVQAVYGLGAGIGGAAANLVGANDTAKMLNRTAHRNFTGAFKDLGRGAVQLGKGAIGLSTPGMLYNTAVNANKNYTATQKAQQGAAKPAAPAAKPAAPAKQETPAKPGAPAQNQMDSQMQQYGIGAAKGTPSANLGINTTNPTVSTQPQAEPQAAPQAAGNAGGGLLDPGNAGNTTFDTDWNKPKTPAPAKPISQQGQQMLNQANNDAIFGSNNPHALNVSAPAPAAPAAAPAAPAAPTYDPKSITAAQMKQYRGQTGASDMNSDLDKWKTFEAMQGRGAQATNAAYRKFKKG